MAQVKTTKRKNINDVPDKLLGAAWGPQKERMDAGIYFPLFIVLVNEGTKRRRIFYLSADLQTPEMFVPRKQLSKEAKRAGWRGFYYDMAQAREGLVRIA